MRIAKRTLRVRKSELCGLFNIPETVEITGVRTGSDGSIEFQLISAGAVSVGNTKVTIIQEEHYSNYRAIGLEALAKAHGDVSRSFITDEYVNVRPTGGYVNASAVDFAGVVGSPIANSPATVVTNEQSEAKALSKAEQTAREIVEKLKNL